MYLNDIYADIRSLTRHSRAPGQYSATKSYDNRKRNQNQNCSPACDLQTTFSPLEKNDRKDTFAEFKLYECKMQRGVILRCDRRYPRDDLDVRTTNSTHITSRKTLLLRRAARDAKTANKGEAAPALPSTDKDGVVFTKTNHTSQKTTEIVSSLLLEEHIFSRSIRYMGLLQDTEYMFDFVLFIGN
ncbi:hypothetical protein EVAR_91740_1 [Eumeta japonica]|uniref:Uncharacterized protein n=1 Tax=Eumeta variegata TaxID=151549 RepID=A0A4C1TMT3_EUMVA|nr:hypothetical protein EVAR_91740_1 [Eumeta japonica]